MKTRTTDEVIDAMGGTGSVAELCDLSDSAISQWRSKGIPKPWQRYLRLARPDVWADVAGIVKPPPNSG